MIYGDDHWDSAYYYMSFSDGPLDPEYESFIGDVNDMLSDVFGILEDDTIGDRKKIKLVKKLLDDWAKDML